MEIQRNSSPGAVSGKRLADLVTRPAILLMLCGLAIFRAVAFLISPGRAYHDDFDVFYSAAIAYRQGFNPYTFDLTPIGERLGFHLGLLFHSTDTPTALLFFLPFSLPAVPTAHAIWIVFDAVVFAAALILLLAPRYIATKRAVR